MSDVEEHWHLDKRVPVTIIFSLVLQTAVFVWMLSTMHAQIEQNDRRLAMLETRTEGQRSTTTVNTTAIAVINENLRGVTDTLKRIETKLDEK